MGEAVAAVVADSRYLAEDAAARVAVDYDPLPSISDCRAAVAPGAPRARLATAGNVLVEFVQEYGDCDQAFAEAAHVFATSLRQHRGCAHPIEGRGAVVANRGAETGPPGEQVAWLVSAEGEPRRLEGKGAIAIAPADHLEAALA